MLNSVLPVIPVEKPCASFTHATEINIVKNAKAKVATREANATASHFIFTGSSIVMSIASASLLFSLLLLRRRFV